MMELVVVMWGWRCWSYHRDNGNVCGGAEVDMTEVAW